MHGQTYIKCTAYFSTVFVPVFYSNKYLAIYAKIKSETPVKTFT